MKLLPDQQRKIREEEEVVIVCPQWLDGAEISRSERIRASQRVEELTRRLWEQEEEHQMRRQREREEAHMKKRKQGVTSTA